MAKKKRKYEIVGIAGYGMYADDYIKLAETNSLRVAKQLKKKFERECDYDLVGLAGMTKLADINRIKIYKVSCD